MENGRYHLRCQGCDQTFPSGLWILHCPACNQKALLVSEYHEPLSFEGRNDNFFSYAKWLPYENILHLKGPKMAAIKSEVLGNAIGLDELWLLISGFAPEIGADFMTGTFKDCEAIGVLNRVNEQTNKLLIVASAGNAGRAFLELGLRHNLPSIIVMPEQARSKVSLRTASRKAPLLVLLSSAQYPDAIRLVDKAIERFSEKLVREGGGYNVARRDSMGVPFLNAVRHMQSIPDWYVQAVGSGTGAIAAWEGAKRIRKSNLVKDGNMRLLLVQNEPFSPMVDAWRSGEREIERMNEEEARCRLDKVRAKVLSNTTPPYAVRGGVYDSLKASGGDMCAVANEQIISAQYLAQKKLGFEICDAAGAALAGLIKSVGEELIHRDERVLLHLTGVGLKEVIKNTQLYDYPNTVTVPSEDFTGAFVAIEHYLEEILDH